MIDEDEDFDIILVATGSEVNLALDSAKLLREKGVGVRVVSMPSQELFRKQEIDYQEEVLPSWCMCCVSIEAGTTFGWERFIGRDGLAIGLDHFGASAPSQGAGREIRFHAGRCARPDRRPLRLRR